MKVGRKKQSSPGHVSTMSDSERPNSEFLVYDLAELDAIKEFIKAKFPLSILK